MKKIKLFINSLRFNLRLFLQFLKSKRLKFYKFIFNLYMIKKIIYIIYTYFFII